MSPAVVEGPSLPAISVRAPWWYFIFHCGKTIENRTWKTQLRGPVLIQASGWWNEDDVHDDCLSADRMNGQNGLVPYPTPASLAEMKRLGGHVIGVVDIVGTVMRSTSPWFVGPVGWVLTNPRLFKRPIKARGTQTMFRVPEARLFPDDLEAAGRRAA